MQHRRLLQVLAALALVWIVGIAVLQLGMWRAAREELQGSDQAASSSAGAGTDIAAPDAAPARTPLQTHVFYYPWYGTKERDGFYYHWAHDVLDWAGKPTGKRFEAPEDIGTNFWPQGGLYSSRDEAVIDRHMRQIRSAGISVVCTSWWGENNADGQLKDSPGFSDSVVQVLLDAALEHGLQVSFHLEPYPGRSATSVRGDLQYLHRKYGEHPAVSRIDGRIVVFVYDAYLTSARDWATLLMPNGRQSVRGLPEDPFVIGLLVKQKELADLARGGFDGVYTYFAADTFVYGSTPRNWPRIHADARRHNLVFVPCVGPGYDDLRIRPFNRGNRHAREGGAYYRRMWKAAIAERPRVVGITSWNEWLEGTQIEPVEPHASSSFTYLDYQPQSPSYYLDVTSEMIREYEDAVQGSSD